ncbi:YjaG family protein [Nitrincola sp. MINF-07-Sa-05]|uniref:YjaG family protein n=1 Tax=Nitrincola salilacus TaxID=3400273 RepID=UPI003917B703
MKEWQELEHQLEQFKPWQLTACAVAFTERMFPNFSLFSKLLSFGDSDKLRQVLNALWDQFTGSGARMNFEVQLDHVEANMPSLEEYDMYGAMPALDAVVALYSTLVTVLEEDPQEVLSIIQLSQESVATFIEVNHTDPQMSDIELVRFISTHELMLDEEAFREEVLERVSRQVNPDKAFISQLRELAENQGISNIGISDDE